MVILYKTSRRIRTLADSRMSWSRTILALRLQCLEPKEGKKATIQFISLVFRQTHQETNCLSPRTTPSLQIVAVSWWVDLCLNLTVLLRLAQRSSHTATVFVRQLGQFEPFKISNRFQQARCGSDNKHRDYPPFTSNLICNQVAFALPPGIRAVYLSLPWQRLFMR